MRFPSELWPNPFERQLVEDLVVLFAAQPVVLTDRLTNSVYLNEAAEELFGDRAPALVNRVAASLLGFGHDDKLPEKMLAALMGEGAPWRGLIELVRGEPRSRRLVEATAIASENRFVCGVLRFGAEPAVPLREGLPESLTAERR